MAAGNGDVSAFVKSLLSSSEPTSPGAFYSKDGDSAFFYFEDVPHRRVRIDHLLTVYRAEDDKRIVGVQVKAISKLPLHDILEVEVEREHGDGKRVDFVRILLRTFQETMTANPGDGERFGAYADAIKEAGLRGAPMVDLAGLV